MKFAGMLKTSTVDYPKKIVTTVFTLACNFNCEYCHNSDLINFSDEKLLIEEEEVIKHLLKRKNVLNGLCITGGEASLWGDKLLKFIKRVKKELGEEFLIKIDTNGSNIDFLKEAINIVDFIAMDLKAIDYSLFSNEKLENIIKAMELLKGARDYEIRLTMYPKYIKEEEFEEYIRLLKGTKKVIVQQYKKNKNSTTEAYDKKILHKFKEILERGRIQVEIRGV